MNCAILGLPQSGKSTLFTAVSGIKPDPSDTVHHKRAVVSVPDARLPALANEFRSKKTTYATIEFWDFPGCYLADAHGRDQWRRFLPDLRQADALVIVVRDFENPAVPPYRDRIDPKADLEEMWEELIFADLEVVSNRIERLEKALSKPTDTHDEEKRELAILQQCLQVLENTEPISSVLHDAEEQHLFASFGFLTAKPLVVVQNVAEDRAAEETGPPPAHARAAVKLSAEVEAEIAELDEADRSAFLADLGVQTSARDRLIHACYKAMGYITFFTAKTTEARAWAIPTGLTALDAAGKVHSDLARGFIRAETVAFDDLAAAGDYKSAKAAGKVRLEGKTYVVQDGDILLIKFSV
jgi:GTP-binding protein YchF